MLVVRSLCERSLMSALKRKQRERASGQEMWDSWVLALTGGGEHHKPEFPQAHGDMVGRESWRTTVLRWWLPQKDCGLWAGSATAVLGAEAALLLAPRQACSKSLPTSGAQFTGKQRHCLLSPPWSCPQGTQSSSRVCECCRENGVSTICA